MDSVGLEYKTQKFLSITIVNHSASVKRKKIEVTGTQKHLRFLYTWGNREQLY